MKSGLLWWARSIVLSAVSLLAAVSTSCAAPDQGAGGATSPDVEPDGVASITYYTKTLTMKGGECASSVGVQDLSASSGSADPAPIEGRVGAAAHSLDSYIGGGASDRQHVVKFL
jgi:hypothetical protein